jgi:hypothetical protein
MFDEIRQFLIYAVVIAVIGTIWTLGWARAQNDRSETGYYPPARPELFKQIMKEAKEHGEPVAQVDPNQ